VVLGRSSEKGDTSDVNLLDSRGQGAVGFGGLQDERVQVADDEGDWGDRIVGQVFQVGGDVSGEDT
jgi:hypothetical protein